MKRSWLLLFRHRYFQVINKHEKKLVSFSCGICSTSRQVIIPETMKDLYYLYYHSNWEWEREALLISSDRDMPSIWIPCTGYDCSLAFTLCLWATSYMLEVTDQTNWFSSCWEGTTEMYEEWGGFREKLKMFSSCSMNVSFHMMNTSVNCFIHLLLYDKINIKK